MKGFEEKVTYIVGGSSGIGLATAKLLSAKGAHVTIFARRKKLLEQALMEISSEAVSKRQRFSCLSLDITERQQVETTMQKAMSEFGLPDVLINSAGVSHPGYFEHVTYQHFDETMKINLYGIWNTVSALVPYMKKRGGYIVNVSSVAGFIGLFGATAYTASKYAVIGLSEALRSELKPYGIWVSVLCPPDTDTPLLHEANKTKPPETKIISGKARLMRPEVVAQALIRGMQKNQFMIIPGFDSKGILIVKRLLPSLVEYFMDSAIKKSGAEKFRTEY